MSCLGAFGCYQRCPHPGPTSSAAWPRIACKSASGWSKVTLTRHRREVLIRLSDGPKTLDEARDRGKNILPSLITDGLARFVGDGLYQITEAGTALLAVSVEPPDRS
jgi:hypothetical protein